MQLDFIVGGAPKCATSTIFEILRKHPMISEPLVKEGHYFSFPEVSETYYDVQFLKSKKEFYSNYTATAEQLIGDFSPSYLRLYKYALPRIYKENGNAKLIFIVRDPISRLKSHHLMDERLGYYNSNLEKATLTNPLYHNEYIKCGLYFEAIEYAENLFGEENVKVLFFENFILNPEGIIKEICKFLCIDQEANLAFNQKENVGLVSKFSFITRFKRNKLIKLVINMLPKYFITALKVLLYREKNDSDNTHIDYNVFLKYFQDDIVKMADKYPVIKEIWPSYGLLK